MTRFLPRPTTVLSGILLLMITAALLACQSQTNTNEQSTPNTANSGAPSALSTEGASLPTTVPEGESQSSGRGAELPTGTPEPTCPAASGEIAILPPTQTSEETDREALVALFEATDGDTWDNSGLWAGSRTIGDWPGVALDDSGRVVELNLGKRGLRGELPRELGNLTSLTLLDLQENQLTGQIPSNFGNLANLETLYLSENQLTGEIPADIGNLRNLTALGLTGNRLCGELPPDLGDLVNLTELNLSENQLTGEIPPELGGLVNLTELNLSGNQLTGEIPPELGDAGSRTLLGLSRVNSVLESQTALDLSNNLLNGEIPGDLDKPWRHFDLSGNQFSGCVSDYLRDLGARSDWERRIGDFLAGLPVCEASDPNDKATLVAIYNEVGDPGWPGWLGREPIGEWWGVSTDREGRVIDLHFGDYTSNPAKFAGDIPAELSNLTLLRSLNLRDSALTGVIPPELGNLESLRILALDYNELMGRYRPNWATSQTWNTWLSATTAN